MLVVVHAYNNALATACFLANMLYIRHLVTFCSFVGSDSEEVKLSKILEIMDESPSLRNKPKFLVAQACRGRE